MTDPKGNADDVRWAIFCSSVGFIPCLSNEITETWDLVCRFEISHQWRTEQIYPPLAFFEFLPRGGIFARFRDPRVRFGQKSAF